MLLFAQRFRASAETPPVEADVTGSGSRAEVSSGALDFSCARCWAPLVGGRITCVRDRLENLDFASASISISHRVFSYMCYFVTSTSDLQILAKIPCNKLRGLALTKKWAAFQSVLLSAQRSPIDLAQRTVSSQVGVSLSLTRKVVMLAQPTWTLHVATCFEDQSFFV